MILGRLTALAVSARARSRSRYKLRYGVKGNPKGEALLGKLIQTVQSEAGERGLTLCNRTDHLVWAATGN